MFAEHCLGDQTMDNMMSLIVLKCPWVAETLSAMRERSCCNGSSTSQKGMVSTSPTLSLQVSPQQSFPSTLLQVRVCFSQESCTGQRCPLSPEWALCWLCAGLQGSTVQGHTQIPTAQSLHSPRAHPALPPCPQPLQEHLWAVVLLKINATLLLPVVFRN